MVTRDRVYSTKPPNQEVRCKNATTGAGGTHESGLLDLVPLELLILYTLSICCCARDSNCALTCGQELGGRRQVWQADKRPDTTKD